VGSGSFGRAAAAMAALLELDGGTLPQQQQAAVVVPADAEAGRPTRKRRLAFCKTSGCKRSSHGHDLPPGPSSVDATFMWPFDFAARLAGAPWDQLVAHWQHGISVSTDYSGSGQAETSFTYIREVLLSQGQPLGADVTLSRAGDILPHCREVLLRGHPSACVHGDMLQRMKPELRSFLDEKFNAASAQIQALVDEGTSQRNACKQVGEAMMTDIVQHVRQMHEEGSFGDSIMAPCFKCKTHCAVAKAVDRAGGLLRLHVAGITCIDWSSRGSGQGWTGSTAKVFIQWLVERLVAMDDCIIVECTRLYSPALLKVALLEYVVQDCVFSPSDMGFPATRHRIYIVCLRRGSLRWKPEASFSQQLAATCFRTCSLNGSDMMRASPEEVQSFVRKLAASRSMSLTQLDGRPWKFKHVCGAGVRNRIRRYMEVASEKFGSGDHDVMYDLAQYTDRGSVTCKMPALTQHNMVYSQRLGRTLLAKERLEVMGLPTYVPDTFAFKNPVLKSVETGTITDSQLQRLMGNGMHAAAIGAAIMIVLANSDRP